MTEALASSAMSLFRSTSTRKHAPFPALGFRTGISPTLLYPDFMENQVLAVAADGSVWTLTRDGICQYSVGKAKLSRLGDNKLHKPSPLAFPQHLAPVSSKLAYYIQSRDNRPVISVYERDKAIVDLAPLPDNDTPQALSAAADGSLWVLGSSGKPWRLSNGGWVTVAAPSGTKLLQVSVGAADFVLAIGQKDGVSQVLRLKDGSWIAHDELPHVGVRWIGGCAGGEYWWSSADLQRSGELHLIKDATKLMSFALDKGAVGFAAATRRSCYFFSFAHGGFARAAQGVIDQADEAWPAMNSGEKLAYNEISDRLGIIEPEGVRGQYTNINAAFSAWLSKIDTIKRPSNIPEADWSSVCEQIKDELEYVQSVTTLSTNLALLNGCMGQIYTNVYNQVVTMLGLPDKAADMPGGLVEMVLNTLVDKLQGAVIDKAKGAVGSEAVDISLACFKYGCDLLAKEHKLPDGSVPLIIASSELAGTLARMTVESEHARAKYQKSILSDWGRLSACGEAIRSGAWYWSPETNYENIKGAGAAIALDFYQMLMPVKWKIVLCEGVQCLNPPLVPYMPHVPRYALMYQRQSNGADASLFWWTACMEVSAPERQNSEGPFPNQKILETVFALDTTPQDFFAGRKGWKLRRVTVPGYLPPPADLVWAPYENSTAPLK